MRRSMMVACTRRAANQGKGGHVMARSLSFLCALSTAVPICSISYAGDNNNKISPSQVQQGQAITPVQLNLAGKSPAQVYLGSYIVNSTGDCSGCHSFPQYLQTGDQAGTNPTAGDPYEGTPSTQSVTNQLFANINASHYLAGGQCFGRFMARNLTPESNDQPYPGLPEGLTEAEFIKIMRTGEDIHCEKEASDPICTLGPDTATLQVMPWPTYHSMTDSDLKAVYAYLTAIPTADACNTVADGCPGASGLYTYPNTPD